MKNTGSLIRFWLEDWQRRFGTFKEDEIRELIFQRSFINIARATTVELDSHYRDKPSEKIQRNSKESWAKGFFDLIESYFDNNHPVLDLLSLEYEPEIDALRIEIKAGAYDIAKIYPLIDRIKEGLSPAMIGSEVAKQFACDGKADTNYLQSLSEFLVQSQIGRNSLSDLKDVPQQSIARLGAEFFLDWNLDTLRADKTLSSSLWTNYLRFLDEELKDAGKLDSVISKDAVNAFDLLDTFYWQHLFRAFLERLAEIIAAEIPRFTRCVSVEDAAWKLESDTRLHKRVGKALYQEYVRILTQAALSSITGREARSEDSQLSIDMLALGNWLREKASFTSDRHPSESDYHPDTLDFVVTEAFNSAAIKRIGSYAANVLATRAKKSAIERIGARICSVLARDIRQAPIDAQFLTESLLDYLSEWRSRIDLHRNLGVIFRNTNPVVLKAIPEIVAEKRVRSLANRAAERDSMWADWKSSFVSQAGFQSYIYKHYPWHKLSAFRLKLLLNRVFVEFDSPAEEWSVLFTINGLDSKERMWKMGNITFYDPQSFDLRDARLLQRKPDGKTTAAEVTVKAVSTYDAARKASEKLGLAMNKTAFILSLNKTYGGFAIRIDTNIYVRRLKRNSSSAGRMLARREDPITQSVEAVEAWSLRNSIA